MSRGRFIFATAFMLWIAGGLNFGLSHRIGIAGANPDFLLILASCIGLISTARHGLITGFSAGVIQSAIVGANAWQYMLTRLLVGWTAGYGAEAKFQRNFAVAAVLVIINTTIAGAIMVFMAAQPDILGGLKATILSALYNGVLTVALFVPIEKVAGSYGFES